MATNDVVKHRADNREVLICSDHGPWARSIAQALAMTSGLRCHAIHGVAADTVIGYMRNHGRYPDPFSEDVCVIHVPHTERLSWCISTLLKLRGPREHWSGGVLFVMANASTRMHLKALDLFGGLPNGINSFGRRSRAHRTLPEPVFIARLLRETHSVGQVFCNAWRGWAKESVLGQISGLLRVVNAHMELGQLEDAVIALAALHTLWQRVDWRAVCVHGRIEGLALGIAGSSTPTYLPHVSDMLSRMAAVLQDIGMGGC